MAYQLQDINDRILTDTPAFLAECDENYHKRVVTAADKIIERMDASPIVLLSGPSGSGQTTTAMKIAEELHRRAGALVGVKVPHGQVGGDAQARPVPQAAVAANIKISFSKITPDTIISPDVRPTDYHTSSHTICSYSKRVPKTLIHSGSRPQIFPPNAGAVPRCNAGSADPSFPTGEYSPRCSEDRHSL